MYTLTVDGNDLYIPEEKYYSLNSAKIKTNSDRVAYLDFEIPKTNKAYDFLNEKTSTVKVYKDNVLKYKFFVDTIEDDFYFNKLVSCTSVIEYLSDSIVRPYSTIESEPGLLAPSSLDGYFQWLIDQHNAVSDTKKKFYVGVNQGASLDNNNYVYRASTQLPTVSSEIKDKILTPYPSAYITVTFDGEKNIINLYADIHEKNDQVIDFGVNLLDFVKTSDYSKCYTAVRPTGYTPEGSEGNTSTLPITIESIPDGVSKWSSDVYKKKDVVYSLSGVNTWGYRECSYSNTDIKTVDGLYQASVAYLKRVSNPALTIEAKAIDLALLMGDKYSTLQVRQAVRIRATPHNIDTYMTVSSIDIDVLDPTNDLYTLGESYDSLTGQQSAYVARLNASINSAVDVIGSASDAASKLAEAASKKAQEAKDKADAATDAAEDAAAKADKVTDTANSAVTKAETAISKADTAISTSTETQAKVTLVEKQATEAKNAADTAKKAADDATTAAEDAAAKADKVTDTANSAVTKAETAISKADTAISTSTETQAKVTLVEKQATEAKNAADTAKKAADDATTAANSAQTSATKANEAASAANTAASNAQATADSALSSANKANEDVGSVKTQITEINKEMTSVKQDAATLRDDLSGQITTVKETMEADYAKKSELSDTKTNLRTEISKSAAGLRTEVSQTYSTKKELETTTKAAQTAQSTADAAKKAAESNASDLANAVSKFDGDITNLKDQIDGAIQTWFYDGIPNALTEPEVHWTTDKDRQTHLGDLYYDNQTGFCYRYMNQNGVYSWARIQDTDVTKALSDAAKAQGTANAKKRIFVAIPTPPYDVGDLWVQGSTGDILRCQTLKIDGQAYAEADWVKASKYTDDTAVTKLSNTVEKTYATKSTVSQLSDKIEQTVSSVEEVRTDASAAKTTADNAKKAADDAAAAANTAHETATAAQTAANTAKEHATAASTAASTAKANADAAQAAANKANASLADAQKNLTDLQNRADVTDEELTAAKNAVATAQSAADSANSAASKAKELANTAQSTADTAKANADAAQAAANKANASLADAQKNLTDLQNRADVTDEELTAAKNAVATAQSAADSANSAASKAKELANTAQSTADTAKANADAAQSKANAAASAASTAQSTADTAKANAKKAQDDVDALKNRVTTAETKITQNSEAIALRATKTEVTSAVNNIQVGGRNYLPYCLMTPINLASVYYNKSTGVYTITNDNTWSGGMLLFKSRDLPAGEYRVSASNNIQAFVVNKKFDYDWRRNDYYSDQFESGNGYIAYSHNMTFVATEPFQVGFVVTGPITNAEVGPIKLELGNKPTDWTPAPEDLETDATTKASTALSESKKYTDAQLKITSDSITSSVSKTYATKTDLSTTNSNVTKAQNAANSASSAASKAQSTANTASSNASTALSTANTAKKTADSASSTASTASSNASSALSKASTAETNASSAKATADAANKTATTANSNANTALSTANSANGTANTANSTANSVKSDLANNYTTTKNSLKTYYLGISNAVPGWIELGTLTSSGDNSSVTINVYSGNGYNGSASQNSDWQIFIKDGYQAPNSISATSSFGVTVNYGLNCDGVQVEVRATSNDVCDVWCYFPWSYPNGRYTIQGRYSKWEHKSSSFAPISTIPDGGVAQSIIQETWTTVTNMQSSINQTAESIKSTVAATYVNNQTLSSYATKSQLEQTSTSLTSRIQTTEKSVSGMSTTVKNVNDYMTFARENNQPTLTIGSSSSSFRTKLTNTGEKFMQGDQSIMELDGVTSTVKASRVQLGHYQWRDTGTSMQLVYIP